MAESTDWITPGAEVLVYTDAMPGYSRNVRFSTIAKVAKKSFTVEGENVRFSMDQQEHRPRSSWTASTRRVVPRDSDKAHAEVSAARARGLTLKARAAVEKWERRRTRENRLAAIAALQAVEQDDE